MSKQDLTFQKFIPIQKIDAEEQMVYGYASTPDIDSDGEIIKAEAFEKALPDYMKFPTIREMHQPKAIGTTKQAAIDKNGLYIGAKIVSKESWDLVKEGVYKAFSVGGNVIKRVGNTIHELELVEISLVDVPANKGAVIEVWKRGKLSKDAETAYSMANLMIQVKDMIWYWEYKGKDTTELKRCLEMIKALLVVEASEKEQDDNDNSESIFYGKTAEDIQKKISILKAIDFSKNPMANLIREGVILNMAKEIKKGEEAEKKEEKEETTEPEVTADPKETETKEEETKEETSESETKEEEEKETGAVETTLQKVAKTLEALAPEPEKVEKEDKGLVKAVSSMAGNLAKMADIMSGMNDRIKTLENTPAATKSKSAVVLKSQEKDENEPEEKKEDSSELQTKKERLGELSKIYDQIGKAEYAKAGHSQEAARLMSEIDVLEGKA